MKLAYNSQRHTIYPCDALRLIQHDEFLSFSSYFIYLSVHYIIRVLCFVFYAFLYAFRCPRMPGYCAFAPSPCHHYEKCTDSTSLLYVVHVNGTLNYESNVIAFGDNAIPNKKYVDPKNNYLALS